MIVLSENILIGKSRTTASFYVSIGAELRVLPDERQTNRIQSNRPVFNYGSVLLRASRIGSGRISPLNNHMSRFDSVPCLRAFAEVGSLRNRRPDIPTIRFGIVPVIENPASQPTRTESNRTAPRNQISREAAQCCDRAHSQQNGAQRAFRRKARLATQALRRIVFPIGKKSS